MRRNDLYIVQGAFENGGAITIWDKAHDRFLVKLVYKNSVEIDGKMYYSTDFVYKEE